MAPTLYPPYPHPIADRQDNLKVTRPWLLFFQQLLDQITVIVSGYVTHTGALTQNQVVLGNGGADIKVLGSFGTAGQVLTSQGNGLAPVFAAVSSGVPYFIASGDTFNVPLYIQSLFSMTIDNEGIIDVDGFLIQVD